MKKVPSRSSVKSSKMSSRAAPLVVITIPEENIKTDVGTLSNIGGASSNMEKASEEPADISEKISAKTPDKSKGPDDIDNDDAEVENQVTLSPLG